MIRKALRWFDVLFSGGLAVLLFYLMMLACFPIAYYYDLKDWLADTLRRKEQRGHMLRDQPRA